MKRFFCRFARSYCTADLRTTAMEQKIADIKRRALRHATLNHTCGTLAVFA